MVPDKDYYADKDGKLTSDPSKYAYQVGVAGHQLDDRIAKRFGIADQLVSVDEPRAVRRVAAKIEPEAKPADAAEAADAASPEVEKPKTEAKKKPAAKGAKKK